MSDPDGDKIKCRWATWSREAKDVPSLRILKFSIDHKSHVTKNNVFTLKKVFKQKVQKSWG